MDFTSFLGLLLETVWCRFRRKEVSFSTCFFVLAFLGSLCVFLLPLVFFPSTGASWKYEKNFLIIINLFFSLQGDSYEWEGNYSMYTFFHIHIHFQSYLFFVWILILLHQLKYNGQLIGTIIRRTLHYLIDYKTVGNNSRNLETEWLYMYCWLKNCV